MGISASKPCVAPAWGFPWQICPARTPAANVDDEGVAFREWLASPKSYFTQERGLWSCLPISRYPSIGNVVVCHIFSIGDCLVQRLDDLFAEKVHPTVYLLSLPMACRQEPRHIVRGGH